MVACLAGLARALERGVPLKLHAGVRTELIEVVERSMPTSEALVIEAEHDAARLLGILYAHATGAKVVVYPPPVTDRIQKLSLLWSRQSASRRSQAIGRHFRGESKRGCLKVLTRLPQLRS